MCRNIEEGEEKVAALESSVESGDEAESVSSDGRTTTFGGRLPLTTPTYDKLLPPV